MSLPSAPASASSALWTNWSGGQTAMPAQRLQPSNEQALISALQASQSRVRVLGGGHSFSPLVPTSDTLISLHALSGLVQHDANTHTATFLAGTPIHAIGPALRAIGQSLLNEGDINQQALAGAVSTGTHGTGRDLQSYSASTTALRLVLADGSVLNCSPEQDSDVFAAAQVALGCAGVLTQITLQNRAAYQLCESIRVLPIEAAMAHVHTHRDQHRHIEFFAFPFGKKAIVKTLDITTEASTPPLKPFIDENILLDFVADTARKYPWLNPWLQKIVGAFIDETVRVGYSSDIFPAPRTVAFNEMEYAVPAEHGLACFQEIMAAMQKARINVFFPIEFRYVAADNSWLSPFYQRDSVTISVHQYHKQNYHEFFKLVEPIFWRYQGRPHWGKLHTLGAEALQKIYPRFGDFQKLRQQLDPTNRFLNAHTTHLFLP